MINAVRGLLVIFAFCVFGIGALFIRYFILIFPEYLIKDEKKRMLVCSEILQKSWKIFVKLLEFLRIIKLDKQQIEEIKNIKNSIIVSTHPSFVDVVILMSIIPHTTCFVAEKLHKNIFFKGMVKFLFILDKKNIEEWEKDALEKIEKGFNVLIFPMGGRHKIGEKPKIRKGASLLAQKSNKNIVIIKLETDYNFLTRNQPIYEIQREPVKYNILYLDKINTEEMKTKYKDEVTFRQEITNIIKKTLYQ